MWQSKGKTEPSNTRQKCRQTPWQTLARLVSLSIFVVLPSTRVAHANDTIHVNSIEMLRAALDDATGGETILLASLNYENFDIHGYNFDDYVTIKSQDGINALFTSVDFRDSSYIRLDSLTVVASGREAVGIFDNSHHIQVLNSTLHGVNQFDRNNPDFSQVSSLYAVNVNGDAHNLLIENNTASDAKSSAYLFTNVSDTIIRGNSCDWVASDCFKFSNADNILFENNFGAQNIHPPEGAHIDFVQGQGAVSNSIFRGNVALMGTRSFQGLFFDDATYTNLTFENNLIYTANIRGISVSGENSSGIVARYNTILRVAGSQKATLILIPSNSVKEFNIEGNNVTKNDQRFLNNGVIAQWDDEDDIAHYSEYYVNAMHGPFATVEDFAPVTGSLADNQFGAFARIKELLNSNPEIATPAWLIPAMMMLMSSE